METFTPEQRIMRVYTIRRSPHAGGFRYSRNRHHFLLDSAAMMSAAAGAFENIELAERHQMIPHALHHSQVAIMLPHPTEPVEELASVCSFHQGGGGRKEIAHLTPVEYPVVLQLRKYCAYGPTTKLFYEGALVQGDVVLDDGPRAHLSGGYDDIRLVANYYNTFMMQTGFTYIAPYTPSGAPMPTGYRPVTRFGGATAERLTSIPDAQRRKTFKANPFQVLALNALGPMQQAGLYAADLAYNRGPKFSKEERGVVVNLAAVFASTLTSVFDYYEQGIAPSLAYCWRPISALGGNLQLSSRLLESCIDALSFFGQQATALPLDDEERVSAADLAGLMPAYNRACGLYMLFLDSERFTGTPIPIPAALSMCRVAP